MNSIKIKFAVYCLVLFCIVLVPTTSPVFYDKNCNDNITYFFYTNKIDYDIENANLISNGNATIVACDYKCNRAIKKMLPEVYGESIRITNYSSDTLKYILNKYTNSIVQTENMDKYNFIYCYDETLPKYVTLNNEKVNIQIAINNSEINIGYPLILNGY
ncbi:MAG TPA: hypothetical protein DCO89_03030 [Clostridiales bacterium]|nr:hypothetical protein [Clostridiales bacterium]